MEQLTKETREILISQLEQAMAELDAKKRIVIKSEKRLFEDSLIQFTQSYKVDCVLIQQKIDKIKSILIDSEFEF
jgi:hypothetical protein